MRILILGGDVFLDDHLFFYFFLLEEIWLISGHVVLISDLFVAVRLLSGWICEAHLTKDPILIPIETIIKGGNFLHAFKERHFIDEVGLQKIGKMVCLVEWLPDRKSEKLPQLFESLDFILLHV